MSHEQVLELLRRRVTPELYTQIRREWKTHSIAEDKRDIFSQVFIRVLLSANAPSSASIFEGG